MGDRVTRSRQSGEILRVKFLRQALERGTAPTLLPPGSALAWNQTERPETRAHYLEQLFQSMPDALSIVDSERRVQSVNDAFRRMFGYADWEVLGERLDSLVVPSERQAETRWIAECIEKGECITLETQRRRKDGSLVDVSVSCAPLMAGGKNGAAYAVYRDISEQKDVEALSSALYRVAEKTSSAHDLQQFFAAIHGIVDELMYARNFYIALYDPVSDLLSFPYFVDEQDSAPPPKKLGSGLTDYLIRVGQPLLANPEIFNQMVERGE